MLSPLKWLVLISAIFSLIALLALIFRTFAFGKKPAHAEYRNSGARGIAYAFGRGMMPWEKESTKKHLISYCAGIVYHISIFVAFIYLFLLIFAAYLPAQSLLLFRIALVAGLCCGIGLLFKRMISPLVRQLSHPDDFASNFIVDLFLFVALVRTFNARAESFFFIMAIILFLYIPLGKIRHCFFFFYARTLFGLFYGRRGVLPSDSARSGR